MKLFISWSKSHSLKYAKALYEWIPNVLQEVTPFVSDITVGSGERSLEIIKEGLEDAGYGLVIVTEDNLLEPWLYFEAGALSMRIDSKRKVVPILFDGLTFADIKGPITQFQGREASKDNFLKLMKDMNQELINPIDERRLEQTFDKFWPDLDEAFERISNENLDNASSTKAKRSNDDKIDEILLSVRTLVGNISAKKNSRWENYEKDLLYKHSIKDIYSNIIGDNLVEAFKKYYPDDYTADLSKTISTIADQITLKSIDEGDNENETQNNDSEVV